MIDGVSIIVETLARKGSFRVNRLNFGFCLFNSFANLTETAANERKIFQLILGSLATERDPCNSTSGQHKMHYGYSNWVFIQLNRKLTQLRITRTHGGTLAFAKPFLHSICRRMIVERLCDGDFVQSIVFQYSSHSSSTCLSIASPSATAPVDGLFGHIIFGKCVSVDDQQMFATLSHHQIQFSIVKYIFAGDFLCLPYRTLRII